MAKAPNGLTEPAAGVTAANPAIAPVATPTPLILPVVNSPINPQVVAAVAAEI